jgi:hypothetical protein
MTQANKYQRKRKARIDEKSEISADGEKSLYVGLTPLSNFTLFILYVALLFLKSQSIITLLFHLYNF